MADHQWQPRRRYIAGVCALIVVVFIWVTSSFAVNSIFGEQHYDKPFFLTYLNTATFSLYLLIARFKRKDSKAVTEEAVSMHQISPMDQPCEDDKLKPIETMYLALSFCFLWFIANYVTNASLAYTSVGSSTILSSTSGLFTLALGALFRVENITITRVLAVVISFSGAVLVSYSDSTGRRILGDMLALSGALFYGLYTILLKRQIGSESRIDMPLFFGWVGVFNVVLLWPIIPLFHYTGIETFELPHGPALWLMLLLNAFVGTFISDYLWLLAMLMTSPLVVTLGISLTIPLALVGDLVIKHIIPGWQYIVGALLVITGFVIVNLATLPNPDEKPTYSAVSQNENENHELEIVP
ncbi:yml018c-like protein [Lichtheimia corymbifera JMRC:FSU:9682]|uniref:Yml018c-like protein n=1 Tax=Lichtheimia corymbifera JMRC:FSU:9682 TaxID=1263082 RepID=A0A068S3H3_9FUNG|nr:yml018c-like protein [Lichtheimia corymbifera JMRC:FSU:9682]